MACWVVNANMKCHAPLIKKIMKCCLVLFMILASSSVSYCFWNSWRCHFCRRRASYWWKQSSGCVKWLKNGRRGRAENRDKSPYGSDQRPVTFTDNCRSPVVSLSCCRQANAWTALVSLSVTVHGSVFMVRRYFVTVSHLLELSAILWVTWIEVQTKVKCVRYHQWIIYFVFLGAVSW